jgi:hypothetical protein
MITGCGTIPWPYTLYVDPLQEDDMAFLILRKGGQKNSTRGLYGKGCR